VRFYRVGLPAVTGFVVIFVAAQSIRVALGESGTGLLDVVHAWLLPVSFAIGLLLTALAISRRTRSGYLLGVGLAVLMVLGGFAVIASEVPYLAGGGVGAALGAGIVILASAWILAWAVHGISMRRARASFAADWQPIDRRFGIVIASLAIFAAAAYLSLGFVLSEGAAAGDASRADSAALVAGTTIEAHVIAVTYAPSTDGASAPEVEHLTLELSFMGAPAYALGQAPTVCLTDAATSRDPAFKPDVYCWGTAGPALVLADGFSDLAMPSTARLIRLELERGGSLCAFGAGEWDAQIRIEPLVADAGTGIPEVYTRTASFVLELSGGQAPPPSGTVAAGDCLASTVSP
jgi:hypothetical protein